MKHLFSQQNKYEVYCMSCLTTFGSLENSEYPEQSELNSSCIGIVPGSINHPCTGDGRCYCNGNGCDIITTYE